MGVSVADVATTLQMFVAGLKVSSYAESGEEYDVRMRADARFRADDAALALLTVPSVKYGSIPLSSVVSSLAMAPTWWNRSPWYRPIRCSRRHTWY